MSPVLGHTDRTVVQQRVVACVRSDLQDAALIMQLRIRWIAGQGTIRIPARHARRITDSPLLPTGPEGGHALFLVIGICKDHIQLDLMKWVSVALP